jgi:hypothetical protein
MYIITLGNPKNTMMNWKNKKQINEDLVPHVDRPEGTPVLSDIDMSQSGSGMKAAKDKLKQIDLHSSDKSKGAAKYSKFISLNL